MANQRRQITFDLKTHQGTPLMKYYGNLSKPYEDLRKVMEENGFSHRQKSVYVSDEPMSNHDVRSFLFILCNRLPWLSECLNGFDVTNIGRQHDLLGDIGEVCEMFADERERWIEKLQRDL